MGSPTPPYEPSVPPDRDSPGDPYPFYPPAPQYPAPPYPAPQYGSPQYGPSQYGAPGASNGMAVAGLVLGILAAVFFWTSFLDLPFVALGIIFSAIGLQADRQSSSGGRGMAIGGLACAIGGGLLAIIITIVYVNT